MNGTTAACQGSCAKNHLLRRELHTSKLSQKVVSGRADRVSSAQRQFTLRTSVSEHWSDLFNQSKASSWGNVSKRAQKHDDRMTDDTCRQDESFFLLSTVQARIRFPFRNLCASFQFVSLQYCLLVIYFGCHWHQSENVKKSTHKMKASLATEDVGQNVRHAFRCGQIVWDMHDKCGERPAKEAAISICGWAFQDTADTCRMSCKMWVWNGQAHVWLSCE